MCKNKRISNKTIEKFKVKIKLNKNISKEFIKDQIEKNPYKSLSKEIKEGSSHLIK
jgi:hypothetical protein